MKVKKTRVKKAAKPVVEPVEDLLLHERLVELETALHSYVKRPPNEDNLPMESISDVIAGMIEDNPVVEFTFGGTDYSVGHTDQNYWGRESGHGVRRISLYASGKPVFLITGEVQGHDLGSNFKFRAVETHVAGDWEKALVTLTEELRTHRAALRHRLKQQRAKGLAH